MINQEFDPRRPVYRIAPRAAIGLVGFLALVVGWKSADLPGVLPPDPAQIAELQHEAFAQAATQPGLEAARTVEIKIRANESLEAAIRRLGISPEEARQTVGLLAQVPAFDIFKVDANDSFKAAVAQQRNDRGAIRLVGLSMRTSPTTAVTVTRTFDGALRLRQMQEQVRPETLAECGEVASTVNGTAGQLGIESSVQRVKIAEMIGAKIDLSREVQKGDELCVVVDRKVSETGAIVDKGTVRYVSFKARKLGEKPVRFYRFAGPDGKDVYYDENGKSTRSMFLATPLSVMRITSGFGMRRHPVLGYNKQHTGIDFGAATGTPIKAAGDGVVVMAGRNGGYGNWVQIKHSGPWETGYAHMSRIAVKKGQRVTQGQIIGYVGATGRVTGPHLHYELMQNGRKVNPNNAKIAGGLSGGAALTGAQLSAFQAEKVRVDALLEGATQTQLAQVEAPKLRP